MPLCVTFPLTPARPFRRTSALKSHSYSVCCVQIRSAVGSVLCDPFFTHLPFHQVAFGKCVPEPSAIAQFIPDFSDIRATLVGHNHYDHNMALPAVDPHMAPDAVHLGSQTMAHTFAANALQHELIALNNHVASPEHMGTWWVHPSGQFGSSRYCLDTQVNISLSICSPKTHRRPFHTI